MQKLWTLLALLALFVLAPLAPACVVSSPETDDTESAPLVDIAAPGDITITAAPCSSPADCAPAADCRQFACVTAAPFSLTCQGANCVCAYREPGACEAVTCNPSACSSSCTQPTAADFDVVCASGACVAGPAEGGSCEPPPACVIEDCAAEANCRAYSCSGGACSYTDPACDAPVTCGNTHCTNAADCTQPTGTPAPFAVACVAGSCVRSCSCQ